MSKVEKFIAFSALIYAALYVPAFVIFSGGRMGIFMPLHVLAMASVIAVVVLAYKDLWQRPFASPGDKLKWLAAMLLFGPMIVVYLFRYACKPRPSAAPAQSKANV
jgi:hypothetical protein